MSSTAEVRRARRTMLAASTRRIASSVVTSVWFLFVLACAGATAALLLLHRGDPEGSARLANTEIEALVAADEKVAYRVPVMQRHWWDHFRITHGILAATDRRLLYVGVPPAPFLPHAGEPIEFLERSVPYDERLGVGFERQFLGTRPGVQLTTRAMRVAFAFPARERERMDSVLAVVARRQEVFRLANEAERRATDAAVAASRRATYHLVQRGESLGLIARRYGVSPDSIVAWNALPSTRIAAGRRLLVKPGTP